MPSERCPQCAGEVEPGGEQFCPACGYPLFWDAATDEPSSQKAGATAELTRVPGQEPDPGDAPRQPVEPPAAVPPPLTPAGTLPSDPQREPASPLPPVASVPQGTAPVTVTEAPTITCRSCAHGNPNVRVLCQRCGIELRPPTPLTSTAPAAPRPGPPRFLVAALSGSLVVAVALASWWLWPSATADPSDDTVEAEPSVDAAPEQPVLQAGDDGDAVRAWQELLSEAGHPLDADGVFGPATDQATRSFQAEEGLPVTGVVDDTTREAMARRLG